MQAFSIRTVREKPDARRHHARDHAARRQRMLKVGDKVQAIGAADETGVIVAVNGDGTVDVQDTSYARNADGSPAAQGRVYRGVPAERLEARS